MRIITPYEELGRGRTKSVIYVPRALPVSPAADAYNFHSYRLVQVAGWPRGIRVPGLPNGARPTDGALLSVIWMRQVGVRAVGLPHLFKRADV